MLNDCVYNNDTLSCQARQKGRLTFARTLPTPLGHAASARQVVALVLAVLLLGLLLGCAAGTRFRQERHSKRTYVVQPGDSLAKIAGRYGIPWKALVAANREKYPSLVTNPGMIHPGWELVVPSREEAQALAQSVVISDQPAPQPTPTPGNGETVPIPTATAAPAPTKVIYLVGEIDGLDGPETRERFEQTRARAAWLRSMGLEVFYCEAGSCGWSDVLANGQGAKLLIYEGHGPYVGDLHHPDTVGGFWLTSSESVSKAQVASDLRGVMAPGWTVLIVRACFSAGHSGPEWNTDIGLEEAKRRVAAYSEDFLAAGAACYFATCGDPKDILRPLLRGHTCGQSVPPGLRSSQLRFEHPGYPGSALWLGRFGVNYSNAFVGNPDARLP